MVLRTGEESRPRRAELAFLRRRIPDDQPRAREELGARDDLVRAGRVALGAGSAGVPFIESNATE